MKTYAKSFALQALLAVSVLLCLGQAPALAQTVIYYHTDALGSPVATTNASGNVIERSEYEPYGRLLNRPLSDGPGFTGHVSDAQTGLSYMQQRYYDPQIGRFLSMDPVAANASIGTNFNRYWYANNNPYRFTDPDGRYSCDGPSTCAIDRDIAAMNRGDMSRAEFMERSEARAVGAGAGLAIVVGSTATWFGGRWLLTTKTGRETLFFVLSALSRNNDDLQKLGKRVQRDAVATMKQAQKRAINEAKQETKTKPPEPPKPPKPPEPPEPPEPPKPPKREPPL